MAFDTTRGVESGFSSKPNVVVEVGVEADPLELDLKNSKLQSSSNLLILVSSLPHLRKIPSIDKMLLCQIMMQSHLVRMAFVHLLQAKQIQYSFIFLVDSCMDIRRFSPL